MSGEQLNTLIEAVTANTRRMVDEQYQPKYYSIEQMMEIFSVKRSTIQNWIVRGIIKPYYMVEGGKPYFDQAEIRDHMKKGTIGKNVRVIK
jgi:hypothetical protein